jgi:hypothetical protein
LISKRSSTRSIIVNVLRRRANLTVLLQRLQVFMHCACTEVRVAPVDRLIARNAATSVGIGLHDARIDRKPLTANQTFRHATLDNALEYVSEHITFPEATVAILREARVIRNLVFQAEPAAFSPSVLDQPMAVLCGCRTVQGGGADPPDPGTDRYRGADDP